MRKAVRPTRYYSSKQEKQVAKEIKGKQVPNSGAARFDKGDVTNNNWLIECKTKMTDSKSFSIKKEWITKNEEERFAMNKDYSAIAFNFGPNEPNYYVIDSRLFKMLIEYIDNDN